MRDLVRTSSPDSPTAKRERLLRAFQSVIQPNPKLNRSLVSAQADRHAPYSGWFKYKEAFSADLARYVIAEFAPTGGVLLDPFAGVGTALFAARDLGLHGIGIELLPVGMAVIEARLAADRVSLPRFERYVDQAQGTKWSDHYQAAFAFPHVPITRCAFSEATERSLAGYRAWCARRIRNPMVRTLFELAGLSVLESVSFTRKDGQYLRWDHRAEKPRSQGKFSKGEIPDFDAQVGHLLQRMCADLLDRNENPQPRKGTIDLRTGSCLELLPEMPDRSVDLVLTSPPYCNRYDYTRTYALELAWLGLGERDFKRLRQAMLSCTVENRDKVEQMRALYLRLGHPDRFDRALRVFESQEALHEVLGFLDERGALGHLNNANIPRMIRNYFLELCLVIAELARVIRPGGRVVVVNDNVRYAGQEVPVDLILSDFARDFGMSTERIWTLRRGKGNSSQQMGTHGRNELRKCVYVWRKS